MPEPPQDFERLIKALSKQGVRLVIIGGLAMRLHGSAYVADDLDIVYARSPDNLALLVAPLSPLHPRLRGAPADVPFLFDPRTLRMGSNFTFETDAGKIDILGDAAGAESFDALWERATEMEVFG